MLISVSFSLFRQVANEIRNIFNTLSEKQFFTFSYIENSSSELSYLCPMLLFALASVHVLSNACHTHNHPDRCRRGIFEYCQNETTPLEIMQSSTAGDQQFMRHLNENKPVRALVRALNRQRGSLPRIFALSVMRSDATDIDADPAENSIENFRKLAEVVWNKKAPNQYGSEILSFTAFKETFNSSAEEVR